MRVNETLIKNPTILDTIKKYLNVREEEKNQFGEVFTPIELICEMLSKLPPKVWKDPTLKWLDPANGIGNFPIVVYYKLMESLKDVSGYKNKEKRSKHIIENMLYMVELNPINVRICKKIFKWINPIAKPNIFKGSFLTKDYKDVNPNMKEYKKFKELKKYHIIMGNPPWNGAKEGKRKGTNSGSTTLWDKFVLRSLDILEMNCFLTFIHPANWRGLGSLRNIWDILSNKQLLFLRIFSKKDGKKYFNVGSRFDIYVLQNKNNTKMTKVIDELGNRNLLELNKLSFLPNYAYKEINKILTTEQKGIDVIYSSSIYDTRKLSNSKNGQYKYPVIHSINKDGITYWYSNTNKKGHFGIPKVILNFNERQYAHPQQNDNKGKYGMSQISFGIPIKSKKEGKLILKAINTPKFKKIIAATKWGAFQTDYRMFKYFKKDFYKYFI